VTSTYVWKWILAHIWYALGSTPGTGCDKYDEAAMANPIEKYLRCVATERRFAHKHGGSTEKMALRRWIDLATLHSPSNWWQ
jgi:hypothetical protein